MKLILKSTGKGGRGLRRCDIRIAKSVISINPDLSRLGIDTSWYGAFGYDDDMELSLFLSHKRMEGLFKITTAGSRDGKKNRGMYITITPANRKTMSTFIGEYDISKKYNKNGYLILNLKTNKNE